MDHVKDTALCLAEVAGFWAREPNSVYTEDQIVTILVQSVWRGDLIIEPPTGHVPRDGDYRYSLLKAVAGIDSHPGLLFVRPGEPVAPDVTDLPDGGALVDLCKRIAWMAVGEEPDKATADAAFSTLASVTMNAYDTATTVPILRTLPIERDALQRYCERAKIPLPTFWFPKTTQRSTVSAERQCERWLSELARTGRKPGSKAKLREDAMKRFPGLSAAAFDRAWKKAAPPTWKESGAPTKHARRSDG